jgi:hypothetical protein
MTTANIQLFTQNASQLREQVNTYNIQARGERRSFQNAVKSFKAMTEFQTNFANVSENSLPESVIQTAPSGFVKKQLKEMHLSERHIRKKEERAQKKVDLVIQAYRKALAPVEDKGFGRFSDETYTPRQAKRKRIATRTPFSSPKKNKPQPIAQNKPLACAQKLFSMVEDR